MNNSHSLYFVFLGSAGHIWSRFSLHTDINASTHPHGHSQCADVCYCCWLQTKFVIRPQRNTVQSYQARPSPTLQPSNPGVTFLTQNILSHSLRLPPPSVPSLCLSRIGTVCPIINLRHLSHSQPHPKGVKRDTKQI